MKMKKVLLTVVAGAMMFTAVGFGGTAAHAATTPKQVEVLLNTVKMKFPDAKPFQDGQGSVMVPIRFVSEALGAKVTYSKTDKVSKVGIKSKDHMVDMTIGQTAAIVDGQKKDYGTQIILKENRTFVPLRLVSEGLGQKVEWDKIGRWVWIGSREFRSTDDKQFKLLPLSDFKAYSKSDFTFMTIKDQKYTGIKVIKTSDLPIKLQDGQIIYSIEMKNKNEEEFLVIRSSQRGTPIDLLIKGDFAKGRNHIDSMFINNGDKTGTGFYPVLSRSDKFQNGDYIQNYDWTKFRIKNADYIMIQDGDLQEYGVALVNPFK
ncbi:copper amine oxidase N-terminal domain-containing protein [Paenibacillus illinoisensis]|uniref:Copper amine oxidase-like domain-containing protein n=1 Tax=Paenibacillus illinoisensis TaxID=59845 RepID=A0A2W0CDE1_9BACL|nr:copper amine oxidase N-terminal domain-containing protein [Paenibacillus illinoisensis]PYY31013.1 Copper amine oxidase-like domain-containing protein [Paenibacillus illinoisensis]